MYVSIFEDNYIFIDNLNISSRLYQPNPRSYNDKIWGTEGLRDRGLTNGAKGRRRRKTNTLSPVKLMQLKIVIKKTVLRVNNTI